MLMIARVENIRLGLVLFGELLFLSYCWLEILLVKWNKLGEYKRIGLVELLLL